MKQLINKKILRAGKILNMPYGIMRDKNDSTKTHFIVRSGSDSQTTYNVHYLGNTNKFQKWDCECVDFQQHSVYETNYECKHCLAVSMAVTQKKRLKNVDPRDLLPTERPE